MEEEQSKLRGEPEFDEKHRVVSYLRDGQFRPETPAFDRLVARDKAIRVRPGAPSLPPMTDMDAESGMEEMPAGRSPAAPARALAVRSISGETGWQTALVDDAGQPQLLDDATTKAASPRTDKEVKHSPEAYEVLLDEGEGFDYCCGAALTNGPAAVSNMETVHKENQTTFSENVKRGDW